MSDTKPPAAPRGNTLADPTAPPRRTPVLWVVMVVSLVAVAFVMQSRRESVGPAVMWENDLSIARASSQATNRPMMLNFTADWCGSCRLLDEGVLRVPSIRSQIEQGFIPVKMDVSDASNPANEVAATMQVSLLPTIVVLDTTGNEVGRLVGAVRPEQFTSFMNQMSSSCHDSPGIP